MKSYKLGLLFAAALVCADPAFAADMAARSAPPTKQAAVDPGCLFCGWFAYGEVGYGQGKGEIDVSGVSDVKTSGLIAGGGLMYRTKITQDFLLGMFSSFDYTGLSKTNTLFPGVTLKGEQTWLGTTGLQLGYSPTRSTLFYGQGGVAYGDVKATLAGVGGSLSDKSTAVGWFAGGGLEYAFAPNWTVGIDYKYVDLGKASVCGGIGGGFCAGSHVDVTDHIVTVPLRFRFNL